VLDQNGRLKGFMALQTDITEHKDFKQRIEQLSFEDSLTGLPNRRLVEEQLKFRMGSSQRSRVYQAVLFLDLDNFKLVNDTLGLRKGDELLVRVGQTLKNNLYESDLAARLGGDEFVVVLADLAVDPAEAAARVEQVAFRLLGLLAEPFGKSGLEHRVTASMGAVLFVGQELSIDEILQQSDIAMYQAKAAGKNSFAFFDPEVQHGLLERHRLEVELRDAIRLQQLVPHYQGQFDAQGNLLGAELLIRWQHPERGLLSPGEFIPIAESSGLIIDVGYAVIAMAAELLSRWAKHEKTADLSLSVNISAKHFEQRDFRDRVAGILAKHSLRPSLLKLEITESALAQDLSEISGTMEALKALGAVFSIDDFGTGYSSLAYLKRLPIEQVKIDQSFVRDLLVDENDRGITETICALAKTLKMNVIAEGVESLEQRDVLLQLGCRNFQGYFYHRPEPLSEFSAAFSINQS